MFPGVAGPGLSARLASFRDGVAAPFPFAGIDIIGIDIAANAVLSPRNANIRLSRTTSGATVALNPSE